MIALTQTAALLRDSIRELRAMKLFWITLGLNVLVVGLVGMFGINQQGLTFLTFEFPTDYLNSDRVSPSLFYRFVFANIAIPLWLTWVATILALFSTAGIIPNLIKGGSIDLLLSKPIGRVRLLLTRYCTGLGFAAAQVTIFTVGWLLVLGLRGGAWDVRVLVAIPIVVVFFSYLFSVTVLLGLLTRSAIASLMLTILFWLVLFGVNMTDGLMLTRKLESEAKLARAQRETEIVLRNIDRQNAIIEATPEGDIPENIVTLEEGNRERLAKTEDALAKAEAGAKTWATWSGRVYAVQTVLPKARQTIALLDRAIVDDEELQSMLRVISNNPSYDLEGSAESAMRDRSLWWLLGTSLGFEAVVLIACCVIFARRNF